MSNRAGYSDCVENYAMWRGQVASATRGKRGQALLRELLAALDAMPEKRLIREALRERGEVCALGALGARRGMNLEALSPGDYNAVARAFGVAHQLIREIEYENDEMAPVWGQDKETPEQRWVRMRAWVASQILADSGSKPQEVDHDR